MMRNRGSNLQSSRCTAKVVTIRLPHVFSIIAIITMMLLFYCVLSTWYVECLACADVDSHSDDVDGHCISMDYNIIGSEYLHSAVSRSTHCCWNMDSIGYSADLERCDLNRLMTLVMATRGVHPPEAMMHFPPVSDFPSVSEKFSDSVENF